MQSSLPSCFTANKMIRTCEWVCLYKWGWLMKGEKGLVDLVQALHQPWEFPLWPGHDGLPKGQRSNLCDNDLGLSFDLGEPWRESLESLISPRKAVQWPGGSNKPWAAGLFPFMMNNCLSHWRDGEKPSLSNSSNSTLGMAGLVLSGPMKLTCSWVTRDD